METRTVRGEKLSFGPYSFEKPLIHLSSPDSRGGMSQPADGLLGIEFLRRLNLVLDPRNKVIWFKPSKAIDDVYRYDRALMGVAPVGDAVRVVYAPPTGPAGRAGIKVGDKVTGWAGEGGYFGLLWALQGPPGDVISIQVERDGKPQVIDVKLEELL